MKVLILCAGDQHRWRDEEGQYARGVPKQLVKVDDEPVLHRTVRQLRDRGVTDITVVHKPREGSLFRAPGAKTAVAKLDRKRHQADRFFSSRHLWADTDRTVLLYGDVWFTDEAMDAVVAERSGWWAYGRPGESRFSLCQHGELFAFSWTPDAYAYVDEHMRHIVELQDAGVINRSLGWELYRSMMGAQGADVRKGRINTGKLVVIDDWTEDFDKPAKFDLWLERRSGTIVNASVVVPARLDAERARLWEFLRPRWEALGWQVIECDAPTVDWRKGAAVAVGVEKAEHDIIVVADADVWCDGMVDAVTRVRSGAAWAMPHYQVCRLTKPMTAHVMTSGGWPGRGTTVRTPQGRIPTFAQRPYPGRPGGGIVVLRRDTYRQVPIDTRFRGWGQEDESWALALGTLAGRMWRGTADLWHLWHDPAPRQSREVGSQDSLRLYRRYMSAARQPAKMRALVDEFAGASA